MHLVRPLNNAKRKSSKVPLSILQRIHDVALRKMQKLRTTVQMCKMRFYRALILFRRFPPLTFSEQHHIVVGIGYFEA